MIYREALEELFQLRRFGMRPGTERMRALLAALGDPQRAFEVVHVGGTNGKGLTAAFLERLLASGGARVGLYTSPHLVRFTERIRIDSREISEDEAAELCERVLACAPPESTFFEVATAMAMCAFAAHAVDVAIVEVGLGGRLDATNVIETPLATVVTSIALDHTEVLGPTLIDIAREKAGIFKSRVPAVFACSDAAARAVLEEVARRVDAPTYTLGRELFAEVDADGAGLNYRGPGGALHCPRLGLAGAHQTSNAALALAAAALLPERLRPRAHERAAALADTHWAGRLELIADDLLLDAAHNAAGAEALARALPAFKRGRPVHLILGMVEGKDASAMVRTLAPLARRIVFTRPRSPRAREPATLLALMPGAESAPCLAAALASARTDDALTVVAGSIFLIGEARQLITGERADPLRVQDPVPVR